jgi:hypothetical protein
MRAGAVEDPGTGIKEDPVGEWTGGSAAPLPIKGTWFEADPPGTGVVAGSKAGPTAVPREVVGSSRVPVPVPHTRIEEGTPSWTLATAIISDGMVGAI